MYHSTFNLQSVIYSHEMSQYNLLWLSNLISKRQTQLNTACCACVFWTTSAALSTKPTPTQHVIKPNRQNDHCARTRVSELKPPLCCKNTCLSQLKPFKSRQQLIAIDNNAHALYKPHCQNEKQNRRGYHFLSVQKINIERAHLSKQT